MAQPTCCRTGYFISIVAGKTKPPTIIRSSRPTIDQKAIIDDLVENLSNQLKYLEQVAKSAVNGWIPHRNPDGSISVSGPPGQPGARFDPNKTGVDVTVHVDKGVNVNVGGLCFGWGC